MQNPSCAGSDVDVALNSESLIGRCAVASVSRPIQIPISAFPLT